MQEVTSAVWLDGLELSYLRDQVRGPRRARASAPVLQ